MERGVRNFSQRRFTTNRLSEIADKLEQKLTYVSNTDDPRWLQRRIDRLRAWITRKENAMEHKQNQNS